MTTRHAFTAALGTAVAATLLDPTRVIMTAVILRKVRRENPAMFDGKVAANVVNAIIAEESS